jgi:hypothetical protein
MSIGDASLLKPNEAEEMKRRTTLMVFYLARPPAVDVLAGTSLAQRVKERLDTPGKLNTLLGFAVEWSELYRKYYFNSSAS